MEDRRSAFPGKDYEPEHNILDGPYMRTENDPIHVVHKRYWALLVVAVVCIGLFSFYAPASMMQALHCDKDETDFRYALLSGVSSTTAPQRDLETQPLPSAAVDLLKSTSTAHMTQRDFAYGEGPAIVIYPGEDTNYALYVTEDAAYVYALDKSKFRYQVRDDGTFYETLSALLSA